MWTPELKTWHHPETVERAYRDLRTCTLMPPTIDRMLEVVGKSVLGVEVQMFNFGVVGLHRKS